MPVGMQHHLDKVGVVESLCGAGQLRVIEMPARGIPGPDDLRDVPPVGREAGPTTFGQEVGEVPQSRLGWSPFGWSPFGWSPSGLS
jgi:hypothetical protein